MASVFPQHGNKLQAAQKGSDGGLQDLNRKLDAQDRAFDEFKRSLDSLSSKVK